MNIASIIFMALAWLVLIVGISWYINVGTRKGEINFLKGMGFILVCVMVSGVLLMISFIVS